MSKWINGRFGKEEEMKLNQFILGWVFGSIVSVIALAYHYEEKERRQFVYSKCVESGQKPKLCSFVAAFGETK